MEEAHTQNKCQGRRLPVFLCGWRLCRVEDFSDEPWLCCWSWFRAISTFLSDFWAFSFACSLTLELDLDRKFAEDFISSLTLEDDRDLIAAVNNNTPKLVENVNFLKKLFLFAIVWGRRPGGSFQKLVRFRETREKNPKPWDLKTLTVLYIFEGTLPYLLPQKINVLQDIWASTWPIRIWWRHRKLL